VWGLARVTSFRQRPESKKAASTKGLDSGCRRNDEDGNDHPDKPLGIDQSLSLGSVK
jgi:hypothetical protein